MAKLSKFIDTSKCTACRGCQTACKSWNQLSAEILPFKGSLQTHQDTSAKTFTYVVFKERNSSNKMEWFFKKRQCMHCTDAACEKVCPEKAIYHLDNGAVVRDKDKCIGCSYCADFCPFGIPKVDDSDKKMYKCHLCSDRITNNLKPACAKTCAPGAISFGERTAMVTTAQKRLAIVKRTHPNANLYGLDDQFLQGTTVFYLLLEKPEFYGLPAKPAIPFLASIWKDIIQPVGKFLPVAAVGAILVSTFMTRVAKVKKAEELEQNSKGEDING